MTDHTALIERLEKAEAGSRELDAAVSVAVRLDCKRGMEDDLHYLSIPRRDDGCAPGTYWFHRRSGMSLRMSDPVTTSLDAAVALVERVLPGHYAAVQPWLHTDPERVMHRAYIIRPDWPRWNPVDDDWCHVTHGPSSATGPLAIVIALLKAIPAASHSLARDEGDSRSEHQ